MNRHFSPMLAGPAVISRRERAPADRRGSQPPKVARLRLVPAPVAVQPRSFVRDRQCWAYRANVATRVAAGSFGAYAVAAALGALLARLLPMARPEAVMTGTLTALVIFPAVTIWAFLARSPGRALSSVVTLALALGSLALTLPPPA